MSNLIITYYKNMTKILHCSLLLYNQIPVLKLYSRRSKSSFRCSNRCVYTSGVVYILIGITSECLALGFVICSTAKYLPDIFFVEND